MREARRALMHAPRVHQAPARVCSFSFSMLFLFLNSVCLRHTLLHTRAYSTSQCMRITYGRCCTDVSEFVHARYGSLVKFLQDGTRHDDFGVTTDSKGTCLVVVRLFIGTQNRLVALHSALFLGSRRGEHQPAQCNLSTHWIDKAVF
jgi:hypothetical protein